MYTLLKAFKKLIRSDLNLWIHTFFLADQWTLKIKSHNSLQTLLKLDQNMVRFGLILKKILGQVADGIIFHMSLIVNILLIFLRRLGDKIKLLASTQVITNGSLSWATINTAPILLMFHYGLLTLIQIRLLMISTDYHLEDGHSQQWNNTST